MIVALFISCGSKKAQKEDLNILFIGIDGMDWEILDPLIKQNRMPNFSKLVRGGASARINTNEANGSAVYWTSIATGQHASKHGIEGFVVEDPRTRQLNPYTSDMRKTKAFWNILSEKGIGVGIIGWFISWPAEAVKGFMISSYYTISDTEQLTWKGTIYEDTPGMVYPPELQGQVDGYIKSAREKYIRKLSQIINADALRENDKVVRETKWAFLSDEIYHEAALNLYREKGTRVFAVYLEGLDVVGHRFTSANNEEQVRLDAKYGQVQVKYYLYLDKVLGEYLQAVGRNTVVMVASDHGLMRGDHTENGVFIASGPTIKTSHWCPEQITLTDICPTMLYMLGMPVAADMDGRVFVGIFNDDHLLKNNVEYIATYGKREMVSPAPSKSQFDEEIVQRLKTLGYIQ